jgi:hypothetical protein
MVEILGGGAELEEEGHLGRAFAVYTFSSLALSLSDSLSAIQ